MGAGHFTPYFGQWVKLLDESGDTGLRGRVMTQPLPARDENGPQVLVHVFEPGETIYKPGEQRLYLNRLEAA